MGSQSSAEMREYSTMGSTAWFTNSEKKVYLAVVASVQGHTIVHFSAQRKPCLTHQQHPTHPEHPRKPL